MCVKGWEKMYKLRYLPLFEKDDMTIKQIPRKKPKIARYLFYTNESIKGRSQICFSPLLSINQLFFSHLSAI